MTQRLPARFPIGTKFVVEVHRQGRGKVYRRHLEFPDGTVLRLPSPPVLGAAGEQPTRMRPRARR
jgi:hypothetical protein